MTILEIDSGRANEKILIEIKDSSDKGRTTNVGKGALFQSLITTSNKTFESILDGIHPISDIIFDKIKKLSSKPTEVAVEFGVNITIDGSLLISSFSGEGNIKISLTWKNQD